MISLIFINVLLNNSYSKEIIIIQNRSQREAWIPKLNYAQFQSIAEAVSLGFIRLVWTKESLRVKPCLWIRRAEIQRHWRHNRRFLVLTTLRKSALMSRWKGFRALVWIRSFHWVRYDAKSVDKYSSRSPSHFWDMLVARWSSSRTQTVRMTLFQTYSIGGNLNVK